MIVAMDHVEVITRDVNKTVDFYTNVLGFEMWRYTVSERENRAYPIACVRMGDMVIEILKAVPEVIDGPVDQRSVGLRMFALKVDDMAKTIEELEAQGVEISRPPISPGVYEGLRAEIKDPNGISIELREWQRGDSIHNDAWQPSRPTTTLVA